MTASPLLSIIVPVLNEEGQISDLLNGLAERCSHPSMELILVDGGSVDHTLDEIDHLLKQDWPFTLALVRSPKGRAVQMNHGVASSSGSILYFLHADTLPPKGFDRQILQANAQGQRAGCFRMRFDQDHPVLAFSQWFTRFNVKFCRGGDQSLFIERKAFKELGGFDPSFEVYEDCEFVGRIYDKVGFVVLKDYVTTSARLYETNGTWRLQYHFTVIHLKHRLGASPNELSRYYKAKIQPLKPDKAAKMSLKT